MSIIAAALVSAAVAAVLVLAGVVATFRAGDPPPTRYRRLGVFQAFAGLAGVALESGASPKLTDRVTRLVQSGGPVSMEIGALHHPRDDLSICLFRGTRPGRRSVNVRLEGARSNSTRRIAIATGKLEPVIGKIDVTTAIEIFGALPVQLRARGDYESAAAVDRWLGLREVGE